MPHNALETSPEEHILSRIKRTPLGLIPLFAAGFVVFIGLLGAVYLAGRFRGSLMGIISLPVLTAMALAAIILIGLMIYISAIVYLRNELIVTNESITQVLQHSLFSKKTSQLSLVNVQDVTVDQPGFLAHMFNYGTLTVETAGEQSNFSFRFTKSPYEAAKIIIKAHEDLMRQVGS